MGRATSFTESASHPSGFPVPDALMWADSSVLFILRPCDTTSRRTLHGIRAQMKLARCPAQHTTTRSIAGLIIYLFIAHTRAALLNFLAAAASSTCRAPSRFPFFVQLLPAPPHPSQSIAVFSSHQYHRASAIESYHQSRFLTFAFSNFGQQFRILQDSRSAASGQRENHLGSSPH